MSFSYDVIPGMVDSYCDDELVTPALRDKLIRLTEITFKNFYATNAVPKESYSAFLDSLAELCRTVVEERDRLKQEYESRITEYEEKLADAQNGDESTLDDVYASIYKILGDSPNPKSVRSILTTIINCEESSIPAEHREDMRLLQKAFGLNRVLGNYNRG